MTEFPVPSLYLGLPLQGIRNIEASAGTGKTTTLAFLYLSVVLSGVSPENILVVTFTRAAAQEVRERIRTLLEDVRRGRSGSGTEIPPDLLSYLGTLETDPVLIDQRLREALDIFDRAPIQTIHSFCQFLLRQMSFLMGAPTGLVLVPEDQPVLYESSVRFWRSTVYGQDPLLAEFFLSVWDDGPGGWVKAFKTVPARNGSPENVFAPVVEAMNLYRVRRQAFREEVRSFFSGSSLEDFPDRMLDLLGEKEVPALGLQGEDAMIGNAFPPEAETLRNSLGAALHAAQEVKDALRSSFPDLTGIWKHRELRERELRGIATYDDLILRVSESMKQESVPQSLRERFPVAFVDESQDTSREQSGIFERIYRERRPGSALFWIGDPKQSIYRFRGADVQAYLTFSREVKNSPGNPTIRLSVNYRSSPGIVHAVNRLFGRHASPFLLEGVSYHPSSPVANRSPELRDPDYPEACFLVYAGQGPKDNLDVFARVTADEVARLLSGNTFLKDRPLLPSDIAVLVTKHADGERVAGFLRERRIPCTSSSPVSVFHTREADEIATVLDALLTPWRMPSLCLALSTRLFGWSAREIEELSRDPDRARPVQEGFLEASRLWRIHGIRAALWQLFFRMGVWPRLVPEGRSRQRIDRLIDRIEGAAEQFPTPPDQRIFLSRVRLVWEGDPNEETVGGEPGTSVRILTVHKSKGLEFPVVFVPFGIPGKWQQKEVDFPEDDEEGEDSDESESLRLLYVALTRARERVYLFSPLFRRKQSALGHLLETDRRMKIRRERTVSEKRFFAFREALEEVFSGIDGVSFFEPQRIPGEVVREAYSNPEKSKDEIVVRSIPRSLPAPRRVTSFTAIVAREKDSDAWNGVDPLIGDEDGQDLSGNLDERPEPAGRAFGVFVHGILEEAGKGIARYREEKKVSPPRSEVREWILSSFPSGASEEENRWNQAGLQLAEKGLFEPLIPIPGVSLAELLNARSRFEEPFLLRLPEEVDGAGEVDSHLRGVIDVVVWSGRTAYLVDYKTNLLTGEGNPYSPESLVRVLRDHRYDLQARIYAGAFRRHLALTGDQGEFGGFLFLFLRGLGLGEGSGALLWKPPGGEED